MQINFSFVIPHKNCPTLLQRCVDSIPQREDIQIIVVDDNSDIDKKPDIHRSDVEIILLDEEHSKGAGKARNLGIERAKGKWLIFVDSDDFFTSEINKVLDEFQENECDIVYFKSMGLDSDTLEQIYRGNGYNNLIDRYREYHNSMAEKMLRYNHVVPWGKIIKRSLIKKYSVKFEEVRYSNDVMFATMTGYYAEKILAEDIVVYCITSRAGSLVTQVSIESKRCRFSVYVRRLKFFWEVHEWQAISSLYSKLFGIWKQYGFDEFCVFVKIMRSEGTKWYHVIAYGLIHLYYGTIRKLTYHK